MAILETRCFHQKVFCNDKCNYECVFSGIDKSKTNFAGFDSNFPHLSGAINQQILRADLGGITSPHVFALMFRKI